MLYLSIYQLMDVVFLDNTTLDSMYVDIRFPFSWV